MPLVWGRSDRLQEQSGELAEQEGTMRKGKILKMRPGHNANCSSYAYLGGILVGFVGYMLLLPILAVVQSSLRTRSLGSKLGVGTLRIAWWIVPHLLVLAALLAWAFASGAMEYGSAFYVGGLALIMLIGMGVGWARIATKSRAAQKAASICPRCGGQVIPADSECPWCELDLAAARE